MISLGIRLVFHQSASRLWEGLHSRECLYCQWEKVNRVPFFLMKPVNRFNVTFPQANYISNKLYFYSSNVRYIRDSHIGTCHKTFTTSDLCQTNSTCPVSDLFSLRFHLLSVFSVVLYLYFLFTVYRTYLKGGNSLLCKGCMTVHEWLKDTWWYKNNALLDGGQHHDWIVVFTERSSLLAPDDPSQPRCPVVQETRTHAYTHPGWVER